MINYQTRIQKLAHLIREYNLERIIVYGNENVRYFCGYYPFFGDSLFILNKSEEKRLLFRFEWDTATIGDFFKKEEIVPTYEFPTVIKDILKQPKGNTGLVGSKKMNYNLFVTIKNICVSGITYLDEDVKRIRIIKDPEEIRLIQHAVQITEESIGTSIEQFNVGMSEAELGAIFEFEVKKRNAQEFAFPSMVASGLNAKQVACVPTAKKMKLNEVLVFDVGARYGGYCADIARTYFIGEPSKEYLEIYRKILDIQEELISYIKPGLIASQVTKKAQSLFDKYNLGILRHRAGHGLGIETSMEGPDLKYDEYMLEEGMTFALEISHEGTEEGGIKIEDNILLQKDGCYCFTKSSRDLQIIK